MIANSGEPIVKPFRVLVLNAGTKLAMLVLLAITVNERGGVPSKGSNHLETVGGGGGVVVGHGKGDGGVGAVAVAVVGEHAVRLVVDDVVVGVGRGCACVEEAGV